MIRVIQDIVLIRPDPEGERPSESFLVIPEDARVNMRTGRVVEVGPGRTTEDGKLHPTVLKQGDRVLYNQMLRLEASEDPTDDLEVTREREIYAVLRAPYDIRTNQHAPLEVHPLHDYVLLRVQPKPEKTASGLYLPDVKYASDEPREAVIIAAGPGRLEEDGKRVRTDVEPGDRVLVSPEARTKVRLNGEDYLLTVEGKILGVLAGADA